MLVAEVFKKPFVFENSHFYKGVYFTHMLRFLLCREKGNCQNLRSFLFSSDVGPGMKDR